MWKDATVEVGKVEYAAFSNETVVKRAMGPVGKKWGFDFAKCNCHLFANWVFYGRAFSRDTDDIKSNLRLSGVVDGGIASVTGTPTGAADCVPVIGEIFLGAEMALDGLGA
ncbi:hypothetical protein AAVH_33649 [Aphelenchoides avenae]|nr:hypothetical protein AAVH_33649 [Aphelenchus avenae]